MVTTKVTTKHKAPLATRCGCWQPALPLYSPLPFPAGFELPIISVTRSVSKEKRLFPGLSPQLSPKAVARWEHLDRSGQGEPGRELCSSSAHQTPADRGLHPKFQPSLKSSCSFPGSSAKPQRGWKLQLLPAWALLSLGSGSFYKAGNPQMGFVRTEKSLFWTFNRSPAWEMVPPCPFLQKTNLQHKKGNLTKSLSQSKRSLMVQNLNRFWCSPLVFCSNGLESTHGHLKWMQTQINRWKFLLSRVFSTPFLFIFHTDPNILPGSHKANPNHLPEI